MKTFQNKEWLCLTGIHTFGVLYKNAGTLQYYARTASQKSSKGSNVYMKTKRELLKKQVNHVNLHCSLLPISTYLQETDTKQLQLRGTKLQCI